MLIRTALLALLTAAGAAAQYRVAIHVYDNADVPAHRFRAAAKVADSVLKAAGVTLEWQACNPLCREDENVKTVIMGLAGPKLEIPNKASMGFAMLAAGNGNRAVVSLPRVEDFSDANHMPVEVALGHAIAHEIGHVLLRSSQHGSGIMTAKWNKEGAQRMRQGNLHFTPKEVATIQENVKATTTTAVIASRPNVP